MKAIDEKRHMLETMKQDYDINVGLERAADKHIKRISAELSAFLLPIKKMTISTHQSCVNRPQFMI